MRRRVRRGSIALVAAAVGLGAWAVAVVSDAPYPGLVPWVGLTVVAICALGVTVPDDRRDDPLDPIVVAVAIHFGPFAVIGSLLLAAGWATPYYTALIIDPGSSLPLAQWYLTVGLVAVALGSRLAIGRRVAAVVDRRLPHAALERRDLGLPLLGLHLAGLVALYWSFRSGYIGYQGGVSGRLGAVPVYLSTITIAGRVALAMTWTQARAPRRRSLRMALAVSIATLPVEMVLAGSRGAVVTAGLGYLFGAVAGGWRPSWRRVVAVSISTALVVLVALSYGTTFRQLKQVDGRPTTVSIGEQVSLAVDAAGETVGRGPAVLTDGVDLLAERLEAAAQVAVVVSQYEDRRAEERAEGLDSSVRRAIVAGLVPRAIAPSKPEPPDTQALGRVYFDFDGNSFAATPMTDLLRNFGPMGVVLGMGVLGIALGVVGSFRRCRPLSIATNMVIGTVLIRAVSYEGFYGTIPSEMVRVGAVAVMGALVLRVTSRPAGAEDRPSGSASGRRVSLVSVDLSQRGGHQSVVRFLHEALVAHGWEVETVSLATSAHDRNSVLLRDPRSWRGPTVSEESFDGIDYRHVGCWAAEIAPLRSRPRQCLTDQLVGSDVVLVASGPPFWGGAVPAELHDRLVVEFATLLGPESSSAFAAATPGRRALMRLWGPVLADQERQVARSAAAVVVPSRQLADWALGQGADQVTVIPHAVDPAFVPDDAEPGTAVVGVGRWHDPRKGLATLLPAFAAAQSSSATDLPLLRLLGPPPDPEQLATPVIAEALRELGPRVRFEGEVPQADLVAALQSARFLVSASDQEGFGLSIIEAMACGCPVIATRAGGVDAELEDGRDAVLVPPRDAAALTEAMVTLAADDALRSALASTGPVRAEAYSLTRLSGSFDEVVSRVAGATSESSRLSSTSA